MTILDRAAQIEKAKAALAQQEAQKEMLANIGAKVVQQQQKQKLVSALDNAHSMGIDDGLAAAVKRQLPSSVTGGTMGQQQAEHLGYYNKDADYSDAEIQRARQMFGDKFDVKDLQHLRKLDSLEKVNNGSIGAAPDTGLAQQVLQQH